MSSAISLKLTPNLGHVSSMPYALLKKRLLQTFTPPLEARAKQMQNLLTLDDMSPEDLMAHVLHLLGTESAKAMIR